MTDKEQELKDRAVISKLQWAFNTDVTLKECAKLNDLKSRGEAVEFVVAWYMETWAEFDAERGFSFEGPLTEGSNLDEICQMYAEHLVEGGRSIPQL